LGGCHEKENLKHGEFMLDNAVCLCDTNKFRIYDILDDVPQKNEYPTKSNHPNA
jgi:hypothetical protein